jgi:hypothetical protein
VSFCSVATRALSRMHRLLDSVERPSGNVRASFNSTNRRYISEHVRGEFSMGAVFMSGKLPRNDLASACKSKSVLDFVG